MAEDDELDQSAFALPPRAGSSFLGLRPADWLAGLAGILQNVPLGRGPLAGNIRPFGALFPIAQGLENADQDSRNRVAVEGLAAKYGGKGNPEYDAALELMVQNPRMGSQMLYQAITATNQDKRATRRDTLLQEREVAKEARAGKAAKEAGALFRDVPDLQPAPPDFLASGTGELLRPPTMPPPLAGRPRTTDEIARGMESLPDDAAKLVLPTLTARSQEAAKPREPTVVRLAMAAAQGDKGAQAALDRLPQSQKNRALSQTDLAMQATGEGPAAERAKRALEMLREKDRNPTAASLAVAAAKGDLVALEALAKLQRPTQYQSIEEQLKLEGLKPGTLPYVTKRNDMLRQIMAPDGARVFGMGTGLDTPAAPGRPATEPRALIEPPQQPIPSSAAVRVANAEAARASAGRLMGLLGSKDVQKYQGPIAQWWATSQRQAPGAMLGEVPDAKVDFDMDLNALRNAVMQLRSESQVTGGEYERISKELPKESSRPGVFARELKMTEANIAMMERRLQELTLRSGSPRPAKPSTPASPSPSTPDPKGWKPVP